MTIANLFKISIFLFAAPGVASAESPIFRYEGPEASLAQRWQWAEKQARGQEIAWLGYEVMIPLPEGTFIFGGGSWFSGTFRTRGISMEARLAGHSTQAPPPKQDRRMVVLMKLRAGKPSELVFTQSSWPVRLEGSGLFWLGPAGVAESLEQLIAVRRQAVGPDLVEDFIDTIGYHDLPRATAFLKEIVTGKESSHLRAEAVQSLRNQSHPDAARLILKLAREEKDKDVREEAVETLGQIDSPQAFALLQSLARGKEPLRIRGQAIDQLGDDGRPEALALLRDILKNERDFELLEETISALSQHAGEFALLAKTARAHRYPEARRYAVEHLVEMDPVAARPILEQILAEENDEEIAEEAVDALRELPPTEAVPLLLQTAERHRFSAVRRAAVETLGELALPDMLPRLKKMAHEDSDEDVQHAAVEALADHYGREGLRIVLAVAKNHPNADVREEALDILKYYVGEH